MSEILHNWLRSQSTHVVSACIEKGEPLREMEGLTDSSSVSFGKYEIFVLLLTLRFILQSYATCESKSVSCKFDRTKRLFILVSTTYTMMSKCLLLSKRNAFKSSGESPQTYAYTYNTSMVIIIALT